MCTLLSFAPIDRTKASRAKHGVFLCECGKEFTTTLELVKKGKTRSCGCYSRQVNRDRAIEYKNGEKIGDLIYLSDAGKSSGSRLANFQCVCGNIFTTRIETAKSGTTKSCGCLTSKLLSEAGKLRDNSTNAKPIEVIKFQSIPAMSDSDKNRFWSKVAFTANPNCCWEWQGNKRRNGYGRFSLTVSAQKDISLIAPRVAYFLNYNEQPLKQSVLHTCDNPTCVNPKHLFLGTHKENTDDMMKKGRLLKSG